MGGHKRVFGTFEIVFDALYLCAVLTMGGWRLMTAANGMQLLVGAMALVLAGGDAFHLIPRITAVLTGREESLRRALGLGKLVASISMTVFYLLLWEIGLRVFLPDGAAVWTLIIYVLAAARILLCLFPQNRWADSAQPVGWAIWRNIPFFLLGAVVAVFFTMYRGDAPGLRGIGIAIALSFAFYLPVVLWVHRSRMLGMLMFPKTCAYVWMIAMALSL